MQDHRKFIRLLVFVLFFILFLNNAPSVYAQTTIFSDDFEDGNANGWIVPRAPCSGGPWQVQDNKYGIVTPGCVTETIPSTLLITPGISYIYKVDIKMQDNINKDRNFVFKYRDSSNWYGIHIYGNRVFLQKVINGLEIGTPFWGNLYTSINPAGFQPNETYKFKVFVYSGRYDIEINDIFFATVYDNDPTRQFDNFSAGFQASSGGTVWFDNFSITEMSPEPSTTPTESSTPSPTPTQSSAPSPSPTPSPTPLPTPSYVSLAVQDLKQFSLPWRNQIYDNATRWTDRPTIERWGCALTSASMILKFWGHGNYANPDSLNNWLKNQSDGYLGDGLINWIAVARFSRIHSNATVPALEYKRLGNSTSDLINEIGSGRPAILKEPGHFVVAKSQTADSFEINDPGYSDRTILASYGNSFQSVYSFTPTHTDLSYILLTIDPAFNLKVFDSDGNEIKGNAYIEEPLTDDLGSSTSNAKPLKIFELPKPEDDSYTVEVSGKRGNYELDTYVYDDLGNVNKSDKNGYLPRNTSKDRLTVKTTVKKNHIKFPFWWFNKFPKFWWWH